MAKFVCPKCGMKQDVPLIGWHFVERKAGIQHFDNCGEAVPDPNDPLKLTCKYGHDHKMLWPIHWECGCLFEYHPEL